MKKIKILIDKLVSQIGEKATILKHLEGFAPHLNNDPELLEELRKDKEGYEEITKHLRAASDKIAEMEARIDRRTPEEKGSDIGRQIKEN